MALSMQSTANERGIGGSPSLRSMAHKSGRDTSPVSARRTLEKFTPSEHGFNFPNSFDHLPDLPDLPNDLDSTLESTQLPRSYGLCGGMSLAARDFFLYNRPIPSTTNIPNSGDLFDYFWQRQLATFQPNNNYRLLRRFLHFYAPTTFTRELSVGELRDIKNILDTGLPVVMGLVYYRAGSGNIWENHQVLAWDYSHTGGKTIVQVYDPNEDNADNITVHAQVKTGHGLRPNKDWVDAKQCKGSSKMNDVIGIICMDVPSQEPPRGL